MSIRNAGDPRFYYSWPLRFRYFLFLPREKGGRRGGWLCVRGTYASLHGSVRGVQATPADKDKVTLRNCFPWDEAKPVGSLFPRAPIFSSSLASLRFTPSPLFLALPVPVPLCDSSLSFLYFASILSTLVHTPLQLSFLSTSFRRDARRQRTRRGRETMATFELVRTRIHASRTREGEVTIILLRYEFHPSLWTSRFEVLRLFEHLAFFSRVLSSVGALEDKFNGDFYRWLARIWKSM